jgi:hypothetical protein
MGLMAGLSIAFLAIVADRLLHGLIRHRLVVADGL